MSASYRGMLKQNAENYIDNATQQEIDIYRVLNISLIACFASMSARGMLKQNVENYIDNTTQQEIDMYRVLNN